jgi:hypothetical protein
MTDVTRARGSLAVTRGPAVAADAAAATFADIGPLVGPLGPLVTGGRRDQEYGRVAWTDEAVLSLERHFDADGEGYMRPCPFPGHAGAARFGIPPEDPDGDVRLLCCSGRWRSLGELRAAIAYGHDDGGRPYTQGGYSNILLATWGRRIGFEVGAFSPVVVDLPALQPGSPDAAYSVRAGLALLYGLRWADGPGRPVAWSVRFAAAWCEISMRDAGLGTRIVLDQGVINEVDRRGRTRLYMPGRPLGDTP